MDPQTATQLKSYITEAVKDALKESGCGMCPLPPEMIVEIGHLNDVIKSLGDGDVSRGIERFRENNKFLRQYRKLAESIGSIVLKLAITAFFVGVTAWFGFGYLVGKK